MKTADPALVLVPTGLEGALECRALAPHLRAGGFDVQVGIQHRRALDAAWPSLLDDVPVGLLDVQHGPSRYLVLSASDAFARKLVVAAGRERVIFRPTGLDAFRSYKRGYTRMYRSADRLILRSRLEVAELGDRPHRLVPSGARFGLPGGARPGTDVVLFVSDDFLDFSALQGWVSSAADAVRSCGREAMLVGTDLAANRLTGFRFTDLHPDLLTGVVVMPECDEVALVEALGGTPIVYDPGSRCAELSPAWVQAHAICRTPKHLTAALARSGRDPSPSWPTELSRIVCDPMTAQEWAAAFIEALN